MQLFEVCALSDIKNGEVKEFRLNDDIKILLFAKDGQFYASGTKCTHYSAPLIKGSLCGTRLRCPWHGACFDLVTGDIEDCPGCDSIASFQTKVHNEKIFVLLDPSIAKDGKRVIQPMPYKPNEDNRTFIVVGGGAAGCMAVQTLRENGYCGRLLFISKERHLPYDRVKLSKQPDIDPTKIALRSADFFQKVSVELMLGMHVKAVNPSTKQVTLDDGSILKYDALLISTGGNPKKLPALELVKGVHFLRSPDDGKSLMEAAKQKKVVIVGTGFIGMEIAAVLVKHTASLTLLGLDTIPLKEVFGHKIGKLLLGVEEASGVKYKSGVSAREFRTSASGVLESVTLTNGEILPADVCLVAVGIEPATDFLRETGVKLDEHGFVEVNERMQTNVNGVFAAGDICHFPLPPTVTGGLAGRKAHIGHWGIAQQMGKIAALNMLGRENNASFASVPFFWTQISSKIIRLAGDLSAGFGDVIIHGELEKFKWVAYFVDKSESGRICAVATMSMDPIASHFASLIASGLQLFRSDVEADNEASWVKNL